MTSAYKWQKHVEGGLEGKPQAAINRTASGWTQIVPAESLEKESVTQEILATATPCLQVRVGRASIDVHPGFDPQVLRKVVEVLYSC